MPYFAPYIDGTGLHMPTCDDRLEELWSRYCEIFGVDPLTQEPCDAIRTGQEDIVLPESFKTARELNKPGEYVAPRREPRRYEETIYNDRAAFVPRPTTEALTDALQRLDYIPDVAIAPVEGATIPTLDVTPRWAYPHNGMFQYIHKVKNGVDVYLFANSSNSPVKCNATLRGIFDTLEFWNPVTGETAPIPDDAVTIDLERQTTTARVELGRVESVFVVGKKK